jgi:hypothetical protein
MKPLSLSIDPDGFAATKAAFTATWVNPTRTDTTREAALRDARWSLGGSATQTKNTCINDGQTCTLTPAEIAALIPDQGGEYPLKLWLRDEAGNEDDTLNRLAVVRYNPQACKLG